MGTPHLASSCIIWQADCKMPPGAVQGGRKLHRGWRVWSNGWLPLAHFTSVAAQGA